jgi:hypothetical protein
MIRYICSPLQLLQPVAPQQLSSVQPHSLTIDVPARTTAQVHDRSSDILRSANTSIWTFLTQCFFTALLVYQVLRHFRHEEPRCNAVHQDVSGAQLDGEIAGEVEDGGFRCGVGVCAHGADRTDAQTSDAAGDYDAGGIFLGGMCGEERCESNLCQSDLDGRRG